MNLPDHVFVITPSDVFGGIVLAVVIICLLGYGVLCLWCNFQTWLKHRNKK